MSESNRDNLIGSFLRSLLPPETDQAYQLLASLDYPIPDSQAFNDRLKKLGGNEEASRLLSSLFEPEDFGMDTVQSAFEKFHKRSRHLNLPGIPLPRASLQLLADIITGGGLSINDTEVVFRSKGGINVDCSCNDPDKSGTSKGTCEIHLQGNLLVCVEATCQKCGLIARIPTSNLLPNI